MTRWAALAALAATACHSVGYVQDAGASDAEGTEAGGPCVCEAPSATGTVTLACDAYGCIDGLSVLCTGAGALVTVGAPCGDAGTGDGGSGDGGPCTPVCDNHTCGSPDQCGGVCHCAPGVTCNPDQTCGNGCDLAGRQQCVVGSTSAVSCCSDGYQCKATDAGTGLCCTVSGSNGTCTQNTDCCDYPASQCDTFSGTCN
jgi:hypothetical protein